MTSMRAVLRMGAPIVIALALGGCIAPRDDPNAAARYFVLSLEGAGALGPVPIEVSDQTRTMSDVDVDGRNPPVGQLDAEFVTPVPGRPDALVVGWPGGSCDERVGLDLGRGAAGPVLSSEAGLDFPGLPTRRHPTSLDPLL